MRESTKRTLWVGFALVAGALEPVLAKFSYRFGVHALSLFVVRNITALLVVAPYLAKANALSYANLKRLLPVALLLMTTGFCTLLALNYLTAVTVITVVTTTPAVVALLNQRRGRDILAKHFWPGFWLAFLGVVLSLDLETFNANPIGLVAVVVAVFTSSFYRVKMEELTETINPAVCACLSFALIGIVCLPAVSFVALPPLALWPLCIGVGIAAAVANIAFVTAMTKVGSTRLSIITMAQRPLLILFAAITLHEQPSLLQIAGIVLVMAGMHYAKVERIEPIAVEAKLPVAQTEP